MARTDEKFEAALGKKRIPLLTLDNQWHMLKKKAEPDKELCKLEEKLNELLKQQGKANTEIKKIKSLKKKLMSEIVEKADEAASGKSKEAEKKLEENKRLITECNEKLEDYEDELLELPREIDEANKQLMLHTMELCYDVLKKNRAEIEETTEWVAKVRVELKERLVKKQEQEEVNQGIYNYMHNIFGPDVIDMFDIKYLDD